MSAKYLTVKEMAAELNISVDQAKKLITGNQIPAVDIGVAGRSFWRVAREDFDAWLEKQRAETARRFDWPRRY